MTDLRPGPARSEVAEGMRIDWDVPVVMDDGVVLRADVFRPDTDGRFPVRPIAGATLLVRSQCRQTERGRLC